MNLEEEIQKRMKEPEERMASTTDEKHYLNLLKMWNKLLWQLTQLSQSKLEKEKRKGKSEEWPEGTKVIFHDHSPGWHYHIVFPGMDLEVTIRKQDEEIARSMNAKSLHQNDITFP